MPETATQRWNDLVARQARLHGAFAAKRKAIIADTHLYGEYLKECATNGVTDNDDSLKFASASEQWQSIVTKNKQTMPANKAVAKAVRDYPEIHKMMLAEANDMRRVY